MANILGRITLYDSCVTGSGVKMNIGYVPSGPAVHERTKVTDGDDAASRTSQRTTHRLPVV